MFAPDHAAVAGELKQTDGTLAVIPGGRGNDFARKLGIPNEVNGACDVLVHGTPRLVDVALAGDRAITLGIVLDEFQEISRFGGESAEWHLRGIIQHHQHVSYVLAGSQAHIIERMLDQGRAFYGLADHLQFGPIDFSPIVAILVLTIGGRILVNLIAP